MLQPSGFEYFYGQQAESYTFYRIPKVMFTEERFKGLSCEAKVLYGLMLDRMSLSTKNEWLDEEGKVYIVFPLSDIRELIQCSKQTAVNLVHELDTEQGIGLIEKSRPGLGKANVFYVKNFMAPIFLHKGGHGRSRPLQPEIRHHRRRGSQCRGIQEIL